MVLLLALTHASLAHGPTFVHERGADAHRHRQVSPYELGAMQLAFDAAADEFRVPAELLLAIGWEASRWNPDVQTRWGGWGMFDLREGDMDPSLEHAGRLLERDPNEVGTDWRQSIRGAAAILADQARLANAGALPAHDALEAWAPAVRAFSGRHEPVLQDLYVRTVYEIVATGAWARTPWGTVALAPRAVNLASVAPVNPPPPPATDSSLVADDVPASTENYTNDSRGAGDIDMIVIHTMQGSYSGSMNWFQNPAAQASAHYNLRSSDGRIGQSVREADIAWHAGHWATNSRSVGIEHEGYVSDPDRWYTAAMYERSAALVVDIAARQGIPLDRSHVIAHYEVPGCGSAGGGGAGCHTDPGDGWDWDRYMELLNGETGTVGGELLGVVADGDIYNGTRLVGAEVWIEGTDLRTTVASDGYYRFEDLPFGSYVVHASYPGYAEGTCSKTTSSTQDWCSIALAPAGPEDTGEDAPDPDVPVDTGPTAEVPGTTSKLGPAGGCATAPGRTVGWMTLLATGAALAGRRRRRP
jgi:hypothetical protein